MRLKFKDFFNESPETNQNYFIIIHGFWEDSSDDNETSADFQADPGEKADWWVYVKVPESYQIMNGNSCVISEYHHSHYHDVNWHWTVAVQLTDEQLNSIMKIETDPTNSKYNKFKPNIITELDKYDGKFETKITAMSFDINSVLTALHKHGVSVEGLKELGTQANTQSTRPKLKATYPAKPGETQEEYWKRIVAQQTAGKSIPPPGTHPAYYRPGVNPIGDHTIL